MTHPPPLTHALAPVPIKADWSDHRQDQRPRMVSHNRIAARCRRI